ncbi:MAG TPA: hypothetical protein VHO03_17270 [Ignavibacteriales bacterium]|nr:hypothetical protein [Ignavibacteriales bacterium]
MPWQHEAIEEIDDILCIIMKADKYQILANTLKVLLQNAWESLKEAAIEEAFQELEKGEGDLTEDDVKQLLSSLEVKLGEPLFKACLQIVADHQTKAYKQAFKKIDGKTTNVEFSFNKTSKDALKWLRENETYWIGKFYSNQITGKLDATLNEFAKGIFEQGLSRAEGGKLLRSACKDFFDKPEGFKGHITEYWEGLSDHITTRAREFGRVDAYDRAGIKYAKIVAVMDARTSEICKHMNGRVFPVSHLRDIRDKLMAANSPEEAKDVSPWLKTAQITEQVAGKSTKDLLSGDLTKTLASPPYHFKCRTITVGATQEEYDNQDKKDS